MIYLDLIFNLSLLVALSLVSGFIESRWTRETRRGAIAQGVLFGGVAVLGMLRPLNWSPGVIFDGRSIMTSLCALFFGPWAGIVAAVMAAICRVLLGGGGTLMGLLVILSSTVIGLLARRLLRPLERPPSTWQLYLVGFAVHLAMVALMFTLPDPMATLLRIGPAVIVFYPVATVLAGRILSDRIRTDKALQALRESETFLNSLLDAMPIPVFYKDRSGYYLGANSSYEAYFGVPRQQIIGKTVFETSPLDLAPTYHAKDVELFRKGGVQKYEYVVQDAHGELRNVLISKAVFPDQRGAIRGLIGAFTDITERKLSEESLRRLNRELQAISSCNQILLRAEDEQTLLNDVCRVICDVAGYSLAWVGYTQYDAGKTVRPVAWAGKDGGYVEHANISWSEDSERGLGPTGTAIRSGETACVPDIATAPQMAPWREDALERGYRSTISLPLKDENARVFGALLIYSPEANAITPDEVRLLEELARDLAFGIATVRTRIERQRIERALRESEERYRSIFENSPLGISRTSLEGRFLEANPALARMFGYATPEEMIHSIWDIGEQLLVQPGERRRVMEAVTRSGDMTRQVAQVRRRDGSIFTADLSLKLTRAAEGQPATIEGIVEDITERRRAEVALEESEAKLRGILDNISIGVVLLNPRMEILELNRRMRDWVPHVDPAQHPLCYRAFSSPTGEAECENCPTVKTLRDGQVHEATVQRPHEGVLRDYRIISSPILNAAGEVTAAIEMVEDITEKASLESQLRQAQKMEAIGQLAGGVAHDFNNMLGVIIGHTELALDQVSPDQPLYADLEEIRAASERSASLTRQLLAFARRQTVAPKVLDLDDTVAGMLNMLRRLIGEDIDLIWKPGAGVRPVKMDPSQIDQIMANLCVNARDAITGVGTVTIATRSVSFDDADRADHPEAIPGDYVALSVSDDGCGMDEETLGRLFEPFFTTKEVGKGTGLGLATVYGIVQQNDGFIEVDSTLGHGSTFTIYLPRHVLAPKQQAEERPAIPLAQGMETVLLVEDEPAIQRMAKRMLQRCGYQVFVASSPGEAIALASDYADVIHLLITDVIMPEMNGRDLAERLMPACPGIKCLFMSGYTADVIAHQGVLDESVNFIQKPFSLQDLATRVRAALDGA